MKVTLEGVQDAVKNIEKVQKGLREAVDKGTQEAAFFIEREAKIGAPVNTGRLRTSIHTEVVSPNQMIVSDLVDYGIFVEFNHPTRAGFMRKAADLARKEYPEIIIGKIKQIKV